MEKPINQRADTLAEEGRTISDDDKRWDDRMTFEVRKGDTAVRSVWTNSVRNAFRKQAGWESKGNGSDALDGTCVVSS